MMDLRHIQVRRTARFAVWPPEPEPASERWYLLHGYAQLAPDFMDSLQLRRSGRTLVAPEGLSRFYAKGLAGQPAASWMTAVDREYEIADYVAYLDAVAEAVDRERGPASRTVLFGFSQGCATASRWAALGSVRCDALVCWAGSLAHDLVLPGKLAGIPVILAHGIADPLIPADRLSEESNRLSAAGIAFESVSFEGGHRIPRQALRDVAGRVERLIG